MDMLDEELAFLETFNINEEDLEILDMLYCEDNVDLYDEVDYIKQIYNHYRPDISEETVDSMIEYYKQFRSID